MRWFLFFISKQNTLINGLYKNSIESIWKYYCSKSINSCKLLMKLKLHSKMGVICYKMYSQLVC
jgi:hypothetical protein